VNSVTCPSELSSHYAPAGQALITVGVIDAVSSDDATLDLAVRRQLTDWFGAAVATWRLLRVERIRYAQPDQLPTDLEPVAREVRLGAGRYVAGDHRETASLHGALVSGRRAAEALLADRGAA
jgi:predicted NAD/FAD-dependent oxidoreductase